MALERIPVAICGAGPSGLLLSALLSKAGVVNAVFEKEKSISLHPQAHFINLRSMEIFRNYFNGLEEKIRRIEPPRDQWSDFVICSSILGREIARVDNFRGDPLKDISPTFVSHLSQNKLIPLLLEEATAYASSLKRPSAVHFGNEVISISADKNRSITVLDHSSNATKQIFCDTIIGADGAGSFIRNRFGSNPGDAGELCGVSNFGSIVNVQFSCESLSRAVMESKTSRKGMLFFVYNPDVVCVVVAHNISLNEWTCQVPFFPPVESKEMFTEKYATQLVQAAIGMKCDVKILSMRPWEISAKVARRYQPHRHVFLIGDAAHQFPPAGGFGMNVGLQDALNLSWKLAHVHHKKADESILESYETERRPVATKCAALSVQNFRRSLRVAKILGVDPEAARILADVYAKTSNGNQHNKALRQGFSLMLTFGRQHLRCLVDKSNAHGNYLASEVSRFLRLGGGLPLLFPQHDIGYVYSNQAATEETREYETSFKRIKVGARFPSFPVVVAGARCTESLHSVDLPELVSRFSGSQSSFHLPKYVIIVAAEDWPYWNGLLTAEEFQALQSLVVITAVQSNDAQYGEGTSFPSGGIVFNDVSSELTTAIREADCSAVLVRPDGHVGLLFRGALDSRRHVDMLRRAIRCIDR